MAAIVAMSLLAGCMEPLVTTRFVKVDAIAASGVEKPVGKSFRLLGRPSNINQGQMNVGIISACVAVALSDVGMFEAPEIAPSDFFVVVTAGQDTTPSRRPWAREVYLELSAHPNSQRSLDKMRDNEIWNVRVTAKGLNGPPESVIPMLSTIASSYLAMDTHGQVEIEARMDNPSILAVRETTIKRLQEKNAAIAAAESAKAEKAAPGEQTAKTDKGGQGK